METNYFLYKNADWKKRAATTAVNDLDIEKAFADQASGYVENKLEPLMKAPYSIGFEIVRKNDNNTRIIGIFAFKVDDHLLFAPVFFLNGDIKGPLLYRCDTKTFVPASKEWANYLISAIEDDEGKGHNKGRRGDYAPYVQMQRINFVPTEKYASAKCTCECSCDKSAEKNKAVVQPSYKITPSGDCTVVINVTDSYDKTKDRALYPGLSLLKMASAEDGTIRCEYNNEKFPLSREDGIKFASYPVDYVGTSTIKTPSGTVLSLGKEETERVITGLFTNVPDYTDTWEEVMTDAIIKMSHTHVLKDFLREPDVDISAAKKLIKAAKDSPLFAEALAESYPDPAELVEDAAANIIITEKKASTTDESLKLYYGVSETPINGRDKLFTDGFYMGDTRASDQLFDIAEEHSVAFSAIYESGIYNILRSDGTFEEDVIVIPVDDAYYRGRKKGNTYYLLCIKGNKAAIVPFAIYGIKINDIEKSDRVKSVMDSNKMYVVVNKGRAIGGIVTSTVRNIDGIQYILGVYRDNVTPYSICDKQKQYELSICAYKKFDEKSSGKFENEVNIVNNTYIKTSKINNKVFGTDSCFIEIPSKEENGNMHSDTELFDILSPDISVNNIIENTFNMPYVKVEKDITIKKAHYIFSNSDGKKSTRLNKCEALVKLARDMKIAGEKAYYILDKADSEGACEFRVALPEAADTCNNEFEKIAFKLRVVERPQFENTFDSNLAIPVEPTRVYRLAMSGQQIQEPPSAIGDAYNPTTLSGLPAPIVLSTEPEDLRALADTYKLPHVFEHGVVGTLADTFNSMLLVDKYIARIEDAVDALYRMLFLIYWRPQDFEKTYGTDDMTNLEAETSSNAASLGSMLLKLLKKSDAYKKGVTKENNEDQGQR